MDSTHSPQHTQKRARQQLSCTHCRSGKLKCNRQHPCDQCVKRSREEACIYLPAPPKKVRGSKGRNSIGNGSVGLRSVGRVNRVGRNTRDRIAELEGLVKDLIRNQSSGQNGSSGDLKGITRGSEGDFEFKSSVETSLSPADTGTTNTTRTGGSGSSSKSPQELLEDDQADINAGMGVIRVSNGQTSYSGSTHWESILDSIEELKIAMDDDEEDEDEEDILSPEEANISTTGSVFLLGQSEHIPKEMLLRAIPPREISEKLLRFWFTSDNPMLPAVHKPTFLVEFEQMMEAPSSTSATWLALFFSMLSLGASSALNKACLNEASSREEDPEYYRKWATEALALADITKPRKYTVEAFAMYTVSLQDRTSQLRLYLSLAVFLRLALRLGYHRDPSHYPFLTPFQAEMRRRIWSLMWSFDVLTSFSIGLPDMIRQIQSDVKVPRNLRDEDFGPDTKELPPGRPMNDNTNITYIIVKTGMSRVFGLAADLSHQVEPPDYEEVCAIDAQLEKAHDAYPEQLRIGVMSRAIMEPSPVINQRFKLELLYLRTKCVLHRRYLVATKTPEEENSRKQCVAAATKMLQHLDDICRARASGGLDAVHMFNNISSPDFLLSAMIICLELIRISKEPVQTPKHIQTIENFREILEMTYRCYKAPPSNFAPPEKMVKALELMLGKTPIANGNADSIQMFSPPSNMMPDYSTIPITTGTDNAYLGNDYGGNGGTGVNGVFMSSDGMLNFDENSTDWKLLDKMFQEQVQPIQPGMDQNMSFTDPMLAPNMFSDWAFRQ